MLAMRCEDCGGRWVALAEGTTLHAGRVSYHFRAEALECPRCGSVGVVDDEVLARHQQHPNVVATRLGTS